MTETVSAQMPLGQGRASGLEGLDGRSAVSSLQQPRPEPRLGREVGKPESPIAD